MRMIVLGVGAVIAVVGLIVGDLLGAGLLGFGLAAIALPLLDFLRPADAENKS